MIETAARIPGARREGLQTSLVTDFSVMEALADDWTRLWSEDARANVFSSIEWARAAWHAYGSARRVCAPVVRRGERVVGILPLAVEGGTLRFIGDPRSDYNDVLCEPDSSVEVVEAALRVLDRAPVPWRRCVLRNLRKDSRLLEALDCSPQSREMPLHVSFSAPSSSIDLTGDGQELLDRILSGKTLKKHEKELRRLGAIDFRHLDDRDAARRHLPAFFRQHVARRAMAGDRSLFCEEPNRAFYGALVDELDPAGPLRFSVVEVDGRPVAYHFGFESKGTFFLYKPSFSVDLWQVSPGQVLLKRLLEYARSSRLSRFDFTVGDDGYKEKYANRFVDTYTLRLYRAGLVGRTHARWVRAGALARESPAGRAVLPALRAVRSRIASLVARNRSGSRMLGRAFRCVFARDVMTVFEVPEVPAVGGHGAGDLDVTLGSLEDLASLAAVEPGLLPPERLADARTRLRRGDRAHVARFDGRPVAVAWSALRDVLSIEVGGKGTVRVTLPERTIVYYDVWTGARKPRSPVGVLSSVASADRGSRRWALSTGSGDAKALTHRHGFVPRHRVTRIRVLGLRVWQRVESPLVSATATTSERR